MAKLSKRLKAFATKVDRMKLYPVDDALSLVKECASAKFDESIDVAVQLGIDAKKSDQVVRGSVVLPAGTGKSVRVAVFAQGEKAEQARAAGAEIVGMEDLAEQVKAGNLNFDVVIASPDTMRVVGTLGQILGPRGLMPNPKVGTVTADVAQAVRTPRPVRCSSASTRAGSSTQPSAVLRLSRRRCVRICRHWWKPFKRPSRRPARACICARSHCRAPWVSACASITHARAVIESSPADASRVAGVKGFGRL